MGLTLTADGDYDLCVDTMQTLSLTVLNLPEPFRAKKVKDAREIVANATPNVRDWLMFQWCGAIDPLSHWKTPHEPARSSPVRVLLRLIVSGPGLGQLRHKRLGMLTAKSQHVPLAVGP